MRRVAIAMTMLLAASTAGAATPEPATIDEAGVDAWMKQYIDHETWTIIAADQSALALGSPKGVTVRGDGDLTTDIRREYYRQTELGDKPARSVLMTWVVDCAAHRLQIVAMSTYADSNLKDPQLSIDNPNAAWTDIPPKSQNELVAIRMCEATRTGQRLR